MNDFPALTTIFTPPAVCSSHWIWTSQAHDATTTLWQDFVSGSRAPFVTPCYPHPPGTWAEPKNIGTYSPGVCPSGMTTVGAWQGDRTTTAVCCSSGFTYTGEDVGCTKSFESTKTTAMVAATRDGRLTTYTSILPIESGEAIHFAIAVMYKDSDIGLFPQDAKPIPLPWDRAAIATTESPIRPLRTSASALISAMPSLVPQVSATTSSHVVGTSASAGTIAAIVVGVVFGATLLLSLISLLLLLRHRQRRHRRTRPTYQHPHHYRLDPHSSPGQHYCPLSAAIFGYHDNWRPGSSRHELPGVNGVPCAELESKDALVQISPIEAAQRHWSQPAASPSLWGADSPRLGGMGSPMMGSVPADDTLAEIERDERRLSARRARLLARNSRQSSFP